MRKIQKEDIDFVVENIRAADKREIEDASGLNHIQALERIYKMTENAWTGLVNGEIVAIFGVQKISTLTGLGIPWMISTHGIEKHWLTFTRHCKPVFGKMIEGCAELTNFVDDRNDLAKLWLKWLGFTLLEPKPFGAKNMPFRQFKMEVKNV